MKEFIEYIAKQLVDNPDKVSVEENTPDEHTIELSLKVDQSDLGKVIGKHGNNVNAMRTLLYAVGAKAKHRATLQIVEEIKKSENK
jgi:predicted RNA-binding protein YlqC (UPF0109 family)